MLSERKKIHFKISKQKFKIQSMAILRKFYKKTFNLIITLALSNRR